MSRQDDEQYPPAEGYGPTLPQYTSPEGQYSGSAGADRWRAFAADQWLNSERQQIADLVARRDRIKMDPMSAPEIMAQFEGSQSPPSPQEIAARAAKAMDQLGNEIEGHYKTVRELEKETGAKGGMTAYQRERLDQMAEENRRRAGRTAVENDLSNARINDIAVRQRIAYMNYENSFANRVMSNSLQLTKDRQGDLSLAIRYWNGVSAHQERQGNLIMSQAKLAQNELNDAMSRLQQEYSTDSQRAASIYGDQLRAAQSEQGNVRDNSRQFATQMAQEYGKLLERIAPAGSTAKIEAVIREKARRAGHRLPADFSLTPISADEVWQKMMTSALGAASAFAGTPNPGALSGRFPTPNVPQMQGPGGGMLNFQGGVGDLGSVPYASNDAVMALAEEYGTFRGADQLEQQLASAPTYGRGIGLGSQPSGQPPMNTSGLTSTGQRPMPSWLIDIVRQNTSDAQLRDNPQFIQLAGAITLQESGWDPSRPGDGGKSLGIWQIHEVNGVPDEVRLDPNRATAWRMPSLEAKWKELANERPDLVGTPEFAGEVAQRTQLADQRNNPQQHYAQRYVEVGPVQLQQAAPPQAPMPQFVPETGQSMRPYRDPETGDWIYGDEENDYGDEDEDGWMYGRGY